MPPSTTRIGILILERPEKKQGYLQKRLVQLACKLFSSDKNINYIQNNLYRKINS